MIRKISDVVPREKRSIRSIPLPGGRKEKPKQTEAPSIPEMPEEIAVERVNMINFKPHKNNPKRIFLMAGISAVLLTFVLFSTVFSGTTLTVTPKNETKIVNTILTASKKGTGTSTGLSFEKIEIEKTDSVMLDADGERDAERRASGKIVVYNNYSTSPQRLIKNTRFETPDGLIYRIDDSITVPGKYTEGEKTSPGSIEVVVYADSAGDGYNIDMTDFTIPGFKSDTSRFKNFYARSSTKMQGGFVGKETYVTDEKKNQAVKNLQDKIKDQLIKEVESSVPEGYVFYKDATLIEYSSSPSSEASSKSVTFKETGHLYGFLLGEDELGMAVSEKVGIDIEDAKHRVTVQKLEEMSFSFQGTPLPSSDSIAFKIEGNPLIIWNFDSNQLKILLTGKNKADVQTIVEGFIGIKKIDISTRPFWKTSLPKNIKDITVKNSLIQE